MQSLKYGTHKHTLFISIICFVAKNENIEKERKFNSLPVRSQYFPHF